MKKQKKTHPPNAPKGYLSIKGGRMHNLQNVNAKIPHHALTVVVGVSGSGKSSLVFDLIYAEAQRRYLETLENDYVRNFIQQMERPDVDEISGLQATIGIAQETTNSGMRSTIGTLTDIYAHLRVLYAQASHAYSHLSGEKMVERSSEQIQEQILKQFPSKEIMLLAPLVQARKGHYQKLFKLLLKKKFEQVRVNKVFIPLTQHISLNRHQTHDIDIVVEKSLQVNKENKARIQEAVTIALCYGKGNLIIKTPQNQFFYFSRSLMDPKTGLAYPTPSPNTFSFNSNYGACRPCQGIGKVHKEPIEPFILSPKTSIRKGGIPSVGTYKKTIFFTQLEHFLQQKGYDLDTPIEKIPQELMQQIIYGGNLTKQQEKRFITVLEWLQRKWTKQRLDKLMSEQYATCPACQGARLHKEALHFKIRDKNIADLTSMNLNHLYQWLIALPNHLSNQQQIIANDLLKAIQKKVKILLSMGLGYLSLHRPLQTLSSGEIRRIRIATQIGTQERYLIGIMYILDEPSIGLHQADNQRVLDASKALRDMGNTVIVIEHDKETMMAADYLIEVGPQAGAQGGKIVAQGPPKDFLKLPSTTAHFLLGKRQIPVPSQRRKGNGHFIIIKGCKGHNLKDIHFKLPLGKLVVVTGVSGSGKSTLINQTLLPLLEQQVGHIPMMTLPYESVAGLEHINKVIEIDQTPIGRTPRSNPATYTGVLAHIRDLFVMLPQSRVRGYKVGRFSFNANSGSCPACKGAGIQLVDMDFLPSIRVKCEACRGRRYNRETLQVQYKGKSIADVLDMTITKAIDFFQTHPKIITHLQTMKDVGLGYVKLGQHATSLSGGEGQRMKLSAELHKKSTGKTLYILEEPTTGLHFQDIEKLLAISQRLVDKGNTIVVIEHNMDVIKVADHVIDLGPEAGERGGQIIAQGTPEEVAQTPGSHTGRFLAQELGCTPNTSSQ